MSNKLPDIEILYMKATEAVKANDVGLSANIFNEMTEKYPEDGRAWLGLARIYFEKIGDFEKAEVFYRKAIESDSSLPDAYLSFCDLLLKLSRFVEMNAMLNKAMEISGVSKSSGHYKSGLLKESQGMYDDAIEAYRMAILSSFSSEEIDFCERAISRCQIKKKYSE